MTSLDLEGLHGRIARMKCLIPWIDEQVEVFQNDHPDQRFRAVGLDNHPESASPAHDLGKSLGGRIYTVFDEEKVKSKEALEVKKFFAEGFGKLEPKRLSAPTATRYGFNAGQATILWSWGAGSVPSFHRLDRHSLTSGAIDER
jgi:hypothetical protein